jgi:hypothetical protein
MKSTSGKEISDDPETKRKTEHCKKIKEREKTNQ